MLTCELFMLTCDLLISACNIIMLPGKNWIGGWGVCELWKNDILILLISTQKLYFGDDDAICDVININTWKLNIMWKELKVLLTISTPCATLT